MKVKALRAGYYGIQRQRKGTTFKILNAKHFSHLWMKALDFTPPPPAPGIAVIMDSPEHIAKDAEYVAYDKTTHPGAPEEDEAEEEDKPKKRKPAEEVI